MRVDTHELMLQAALALERGQVEIARTIFNAAAKHNGRPAWGAAIEFKLLAAMNAPEKTEKIIRQVETDSQDVGLSLVLAIAAYLAETGHRRRAATLYQRILDRNFDYPEALELFYRNRFDGTHYYSSLREIHRTRQPAVYLEIGIHNGGSFRLSGASRWRIGVDPSFASLDRTGLGQTKLIEKTSDAFFDEDAEYLFDQNRIDFAFLDGMHHFDFVLRDFINTEKWMAPDGIIAVHDVIPVHEAGANLDPRARQWTGDVWKLTDTLHAFRPDLKLNIVPTGPTGLLVISGLDPESRSLELNLRNIRIFVANLTYGQGLVWNPNSIVPELDISTVLTGTATSVSGK